MSELSKAYWQSEGDDVRFSMPIAKVDKERRIVSGFATLDNVDKQGDIVPSEASVKAFERFRGNIREMHQPIAVGKIISSKLEKFFDRTTNKSYNGVFVSAYVSKGAQDTWEKVLDGTLTGFSIGGNINESEKVYDGNMDKNIRVIKDYDLNELSLVDNPANQFANIVSIQKFDTSAKADLTKGELENVLWCETDDIIRLSKDESSCCAMCSGDMKNVGFVESNDVEKADMIKSLISLFKKGNDESAIDNDVAKSIAENNEVKELNNMADEIVEDVVTEEVTKSVDEEVSEAPAEAEAVETPAAEEAAEESVETVEKSDDVEAEEAITPAVEETTEEADLAKAVEDINSSVATAISDLAAVVKAVSEQVAELAKSVETVNTEVASVKDNFDEFGKRVDAVEADTAVRKSGDLGGIVQLQEKKKESVWGGRFLKSADL